ncbi:MAG: transglutaminase family protein [Niabella sp.]
MIITPEINALFSLLEDPDQDVYEVVSHRLLQFGAPIMPHLEELWEHAPNESVMERVEGLMHRLHYLDVLKDFTAWNDAGHHELMPAILLTAKFLYPDIQSGKTIFNIERLKRNVWLELNHYLTPLEQINVFFNILYGYFGLKGNAYDYNKPEEFLVPFIIDSKKGNQTGNGILSLLLCELLEIPVRYIPIPNQFVLAYIKPETSSNKQGTGANIEFFIDPCQGQIFTFHHLQDYLQKIGEPVTPSLFLPQSNKEVIARLLSDFSKCFTKPSQKYISEELTELVSLLR